MDKVGLRVSETGGQGGREERVSSVAPLSEREGRGGTG